MKITDLWQFAANGVAAQRAVNNIMNKNIVKVQLPADRILKRKRACITQILENTHFTPASGLYQHTAKEIEKLSLRTLRNLLLIVQHRKENR